MAPPREATCGTVVAGLLMCVTVLLGVGARGETRVRPSLTIDFQSTLNDQAHQQKTFKKVGAAWKPPASPVARRSPACAGVGAFLELRRGRYWIARMTFTIP
jgi:hypothetical protein